MSALKNSAGGAEKVQSLALQAYFTPILVSSGYYIEMPQGAVCYSFSFALTRDRLDHWVGKESLNQKEFQKEYIEEE